MIYPSSLGYSRIDDHNRFPQTDVLYNPLRKVLLSPNQTVVNRQFINPAATQSRVTKDFSYLTENDLRNMREHILIPVDQPLIPTNNLEKVRNSRFMVVDAKQYRTGMPISAQEMQRIRSQGLRQQKIVYDFGQRRTVVNQPIITETRPIITPPIYTRPAPPPPPPPPPPPQTIVHEIQPIIRQTKIIKEQPKTIYAPPSINEQQYKVRDKEDKYKYNLYSMIDQQVNGGGCTCPSNQIIASRNQPQSISWLN